jgi:carboxypeptidase family protein
MSRSHSLTSLVLVFALALCFITVPSAFAQSTAAIAGTVSDVTGATVPNATITVRNQDTGDERITQSDAAGEYLVPSLAIGKYRVEVKSQGMQTIVATDLTLDVGTTVRQDFSLKVASTTETIEITANAPVVESTSVSIGDVVNQQTVQDIPLNGRHFVDMALLIPGSVVAPVNGFLTAPLRGQGSFAFNSAGAREDSINFMINGINLSDPNQNQITFQPTLNTVAEFKIDNQTFSAEYGRNSGSIVNIATKQGSNAWHGEAYEFFRNNDLDARNFSNPTMVTSGGSLVPNVQSPFKRNQFGGDGGGAIKKNKAFAYLSYEELRQRQAVPLSATVLTNAQRASVTDPIILGLLPLIPVANSGSNQYAASAIAPVNIYQGTGNFSYVFSDSNRFNAYYAIQRDMRNEPPSTDGNSFPGGGDMRNGKRQLLTLNDTWVITPNVVNEARLGFNRILITFLADNTDAAPAFGINSGVTAPIGLPQITVTGAFTFGGISGFPQGRGDNTEVASDTVSWVHGKHTIKFGGEFRRANSDNFSFTPGTFSFPSITAFIADQANSFTVTNSNRSNRTYANSLGAFIMDTWKMTSTFTVTLGGRYDWYGTPTEAGGRFVVFDPTNSTLQHISTPYQQSALNFQPRVGLAWDPFKNGKTVIRSAYSIMTDQPTLGLVTGLAANPPYAFPISYTPPTGSFITLGNAFPLASGAVSPVSIAHSYKDAYFSEWNFNVQQDFGHGIGAMVGYFASKGTNENLEVNYNQLINGARPYPFLSASSPIDPGLPLTNVPVYESVGNSSYNGLWLNVKKRLSHGLQLDASYAWSKSIDDNSRNVEGLVLQNSYNIAGDRGLSDFDVRHHFVMSPIWDLPFKGNRFVEGWQMSFIETLQTGNPLNIHIANSTFTGSALLRPDVVGNVITGFGPATNGSPTSVQYIQNPSVFLVQGSGGIPLGFGNLGRNVVIGPGIANTDLALRKFTKITERLTWVVEASAFDLLNQANLTSPVLTAGSSTFGIITGGTRAPAGDFGSSRQIQLAMKLLF